MVFLLSFVFNVACCLCLCWVLFGCGWFVLICVCYYFVVMLVSVVG